MHLTLDYIWVIMELSVKPNRLDSKKLQKKFNLTKL